MQANAGPEHRTLASLHRMKAWCVKIALPFWATQGFDSSRHSFHERFDFQGAPIHSASRRTMVQARQIHVFAQAALSGWLDGADELAITATNTMLACNWATDGRPGWVHALTAGGAVCDASRNAYTQAFAAFGLAWAYRVAPDPRYLEMARQTFNFLDSYLSTRGKSGWRNSDDTSDLTRLQNPHMHLLEAALAWYEASGESEFLERADAIFDLFSRHMFQPETGVLPEDFDEHWHPATGRRGHAFEPGHHFEWVWLLNRYAQLAGRSVGSYTDALFNAAIKAGVGAGGVVDEVGDDMIVSKGGHRIWPLCEGLKAAAAEHEAGRPGMRPIADLFANTLEMRFLGKPFAAGWLDHFDAEGSLKVDFVPASTLYHLVMGLSEADRVFTSARDAA